MSQEPKQAWQRDYKQTLQWVRTEYISYNAWNVIGYFVSPLIFSSRENIHLRYKKPQTATYSIIVPVNKTFQL